MGKRRPPWRGRLQRFADRAPVGFFTADADGRITAANPALAHLLGYASPTLLYGNRWDLWIADAAMGEELQRQLDTQGSVGPSFTPLRRADGTCCWASLTLWQTRDGGCEGIVAEGWCGQAGLISALLSALPVRLVVLDANGTIVAVNDAWLQFAREQGLQDLSRVGVGANYLAVCQRAAAAGDELAAQALEGLQSVLSGRLRQWQMEYPCRTPQGELWFLMFAAPLPSSIWWRSGCPL